MQKLFQYTVTLTSVHWVPPSAEESEGDCTGLFSTNNTEIGCGTTMVENVSVSSKSIYRWLVKCVIVAHRFNSFMLLINEHNESGFRSLLPCLF